MEKINLRKKYPGVANSPKYLVTLYGSFPYSEGDITGDAADLMSRLTSTTSTKINWPQCCLLCLKPVTLLDFYGISGTSLSLWSDFWGTDDVVYTVTVRVPYCLECRRKVEKIFRREKEGVKVIPPEEGRAMKFIFRNPEYAKLFKQMNIEITRK